MNVILIGNGGREHAIAQAIAKSPLLGKLYILPGNPGTAMCGENVSIATTDFIAIENFALAHHVTMIVVGPEVPLVDGIRDHFKQHDHILVVGPSAFGAQLEGSKSFAKKFMHRHGIPTAAYFECTSTNLNDGIAFLQSLPAPYVLKADGLAAGKGVLILDDVEEAEKELKDMLQGKFGHASATVVIEAFLSGIEFSVFALTDGKSYLLLPEAKDYKRIGEGDVGLNTGGMGAVSPLPFFDETMKQKVINSIIEPTINGIHREGIDYRGFVFFGLINVNGNPFVIEYNCRMGDPETEVVFPRITSDVLAMMECLRNHSLHDFALKISDHAAATVMLVSGGYPGDYVSEKVIYIGTVQKNSTVFHAGTKLLDDRLVTSGGRVLSVTSLSQNVEQALKSSYSSISEISFEGMYYRKDIGLDIIG